MRRRCLLMMLLLLVPPGLAGCAYRMAGTGLFPTHIQTVAVPAVGNRTFNRADTVQLTDALVRQIEARTPYRVAPAEEADSLLEVTITAIGRQTTARNPGTSLPEEQLYVVIVNFTWKDLRTGTVLVRRENFEQIAPQYATLGEPEYIASQSAAEGLAAGIVQEMTADW